MSSWLVQLPYFYQRLNLLDFLTFMGINVFLYEALCFFKWVFLCVPILLLEWLPVFSWLYYMYFQLKFLVPHWSFPTSFGQVFFFSFIVTAIYHLFRWTLKQSNTMLKLLQFSFGWVIAPWFRRRHSEPSTLFIRQIFHFDIVSIDRKWTYT